MHRSGYCTFVVQLPLSLLFNKTTALLKLRTKWEDLTCRQHRYLFSLLAQGYPTQHQRGGSACPWHMEDIGRTRLSGQRI